MEKIITCPHCHTKFDMTIKPHVHDQPDSNYLWIFDNGHGGIIDGVYQTAGKRSPVWPDGEILYEGEFNRGIVDRLIKAYKANQLAKASDKPCIYVSIHANGFTTESANGWSVYTSEGVTKSDGIAKILLDKATAEFPREYMRGTKESNFYVLRNTSMPAILSENFFMTNSDNCHKYLLSGDGRDRIAKIHFEMIQQVEAEGTV